MLRSILISLLILVMVSCAGERPLSVRPIHSQSRDAIPRMEPLSKRGNPDSYVQYGERYFVLPTARGYRERGIASWYGKKFHGRQTSNGEIYNMYAMTAAHKTLPLPSYVRVTNLENGRSVVLRVNDRGPFVDNRIIDLSYSAAKKIDMIRNGTAKVEVEVVYPGETQRRTVPPRRLPESSEPKRQPRDQSKVQPVQQYAVPRPTPIREVEPRYKDAVDWRDETHLKNRIYIQVGAFSLKHNAEKVMHRLKAAGIVNVKIIMDQQQQDLFLHRVRIGPLDSVAATDNAGAQLKDIGFADYQIVIE